MGKTWIIDENFDGVRLDRFLRRNYPHIPLGGIMRAIRTGEVRVNGSKAIPSYRLGEKDRVHVPFEDHVPQKASLSPSKGALDVVYMDENIMVINKPCGLLSQPASRGEDSVVNRAIGLINRHKGEFAPTPVHRLDRNVSGVMALALNLPSLRALAKLFRDRKVIKKYLAIVKGTLIGEGEIDVSLKKDERFLKSVACEGDGKKSITMYKSLYAGERASLVELELLTGRPHQLRAHLSYIGHPIIGDIKYGGYKEGVKRPMLHAHVLEFLMHDSDLDYLSGKKFTAHVPKDMTETLKLFQIDPNIPY